MNDISAFINDRLDNQIKYFNGAALREQNRAKLWQNCLIAAAGATPMLIGLAEIFGDEWAWAFRAMSLASSFLAAIATSVLSTRKYWENGVIYRAREQALIREKSLFEMRAGQYADDASETPAEQLLVENVEGIIAEEVALRQQRLLNADRRTLTYQ